MAKTSVSAKLFHDGLKKISDNLVVKNKYLAIQNENDANYLYIDKYESSVRRLLSTYSNAFLKGTMSQIEELDQQIAYWEYLLVQIEDPDSPEYKKYTSLIEDAYRQKESIVTIGGTAPESIIAAMRILTTYEEHNNYYRMLMGLPDENIDEAHIVNVRNPLYDKDIPIHMQSYVFRSEWCKSEAGKKFIAEHKKDKKFRYLMHMTEKKIFPFESRLANRFEILYCPPTEPSNLLLDFITVYKRSLDYIYRVFYSETFTNTEPELYEGFIGMMILFMAIGEMYHKYLDADISRDFYDLDSLEIVYDAYGVPFYNSIPLKFHKKIVKNINRLIMYKGSNQVFFDLCDIFDYNVLGIYQYYLFKERLFDKNNTPKLVWKTTDGKEVEYDETGRPKNLPLDENGNPIWDPDLEKMYDIYFIKANIAKERYSQLINPNNKVEYESIVNRDSYWFQFDPDTIKTIYENEYNFIETKYIGVEIMFSLTEMIWESSYFMGMLRDNRSKLNKAEFQIDHERIDTTVPIFDMLIYIIALICKKRGYSGEIRGLFYKVDEDGNYLDIDGNITTDPEKRVALPSIGSRILGFNFKGVLTGLAAIKGVFDQEISHAEKTMQGLHIEKDFEKGEPFHPFDIAVGNNEFHGKDIRDWILKNKGFILSEEGRNLFSKLVSRQPLSLLDENGDYLDNMDIQKLEDISIAFKTMKQMKQEIEELMQSTHIREEYAALNDLTKLLYTTEIVEDVFKDDITEELSISYKSLLSSLNPQLSARYDDENIDIDDELDYCLVQLQNLCDELQHMVYIDDIDVDTITEHLYKMLQYFKSAKADLTDFSIVFFISGKTDNLLKFIMDLHELTRTTWLDDKFLDLYDYITKECKQRRIDDKDYVFHFTMELVMDLYRKLVMLPKEKLLLIDKISELRNPIKKDITMPIFDKFANIGLGDQIISKKYNSMDKDILSLSDAIIKIS